MLRTFRYDLFRVRWSLRRSRNVPPKSFAKKIYYRGPTFKSRDVFDLAGTYIAMRDELTAASTSPFLTPDINARARLRIETRFNAFVHDLPEEVNPSEFGHTYSDTSAELALEALDFMEHGPRP